MAFKRTIVVVISAMGFALASALTYITRTLSDTNTLTNETTHSTSSCRKSAILRSSVAQPLSSVFAISRMSSFPYLNEDVVIDNESRNDNNESPQVSLSTTSNGHLSRRRVVASLFAVASSSIDHFPSSQSSPFGLHPACAASTVKACPQSQLLDARSQLDLAVQASSVQAWTDAALIANDSALDETNLLAAFEACTQKQEKSTPAIVTSPKVVLDAVRDLRAQLGKNKLTTEDAMAVMKYGTIGRVTLDAYLEELSSITD
mmetsp:Transcript_45006/g.66250  ORF Transcript_45006/g.66250 Transcript_45006/m.66250 type:complete len:261 (+) Transcript_45006:99-881(+)